MAYERVNWENLPSTKTPINRTNLNKMDEGIANIEIGGRNYLYNTAFLLNDKSKYDVRGDISLNIVNDGYNNHKALQAIFGVAGSNGTDINMFLTSSRDGYCDINTDYIFSGWAKALKNTKLCARFGFGTTNNTFNIGTEWTKFEIPVQSGSQGWYFAPYIDTATTIYFSDIKLEKGKKATDWTPAPEDMYNSIYPVGSIYMSVNNTNPAILFGGTWEQIKDRFLLACGSTYKAGATGGEATHRLTINELPKNSMKIPHVAYYDDCSISGGGWKQIGREQTEKEGVSQSKTNDGWHIMSIGNNEAHNNMPPYLAVYMWKRTA